MLEVMPMWSWSQRVSQDDHPISGISCNTVDYMQKTYKYIVTCLVTTWKESLLYMTKGFCWPDKFFCLSFIPPVTELLVTEVLKPIISTLKCPDNVTEVWISYLFLDHLINHWPECWGSPVDILTLLRIVFWRIVWLTSFLLFLLFEYCGNKLLGTWGNGNFLTCWKMEIRCRYHLKNHEHVTNIIE